MTKKPITPEALLVWLQGRVTHLNKRIENITPSKEADKLIANKQGQAIAFKSMISFVESHMELQKFPEEL